MSTESAVQQKLEEILNITRLIKARFISEKNVDGSKAREDRLNISIKKESENSQL